MTNMKKINIKTSILLLLISCSKSKPSIYFDITNQELVECSRFGLKNIYIDNDATDKKGFLIEQQIQLKLNENIKNIPSKISINNIPNIYHIYKDGKKIEDLELMNNTSYTISHAVLGQTIVNIRIWTDDKGYVYKTTKKHCEE